MTQLVGHLTARVGPDEAALAHRILPTGGAVLFDAMAVADRRHGIDVVHRLLATGTDDPDLLAAALLHDAAKGRRLRLWHRVTGVLLAALAPALLDRLGNPDPGSRGYAWYLFVHHQPLSADLAASAGLPPRAVAFIRGEPSPADAELAARLKAADDAS